MTGSKIHLMSFEPKAGVETTVYTVGMPDRLKNALFRLMPPRKEGANLATNQLKSELRCWLDEAVELNPLRPSGAAPDWLVALKPVNLERLCNVMACWLRSACGEEMRETPLLRETMQVLQPSLFSDYCGKRTLCLFDDCGRPSEDAAGLTFPAFSAQIANALVGKPLLLSNGECLTFSRLSCGTQGDYELVSEVREYKGCPYAFGLRFHVETLPISRESRLNVEVKVKRFIPGKRTDRPYPYMGGQGVRAYVRTDCGTLRVIPYRYSKGAGHPEWDELSRDNYEGLGFGKLPSMEDYFANMAGFAKEGSKPQILSPLALSARWAANSSVAGGVPMLDKAALFEVLADALGDYVDAVEPLSSVTAAKLHTQFDDPTAKVWDEQPEEAQVQHERWARANRQRLAACTGESSITFELIGMDGGSDSEVLECVRNEIVYFLGEEGVSDGVGVRIVRVCKSAMLLPLSDSGDAAAKLRWREVERGMGKACGLTACIVALQDAAFFVGKESGKNLDPKAAIRMGMARSGRLSQFVVPQVNDGLKHRARAAVRDLMRQLGFIPELRMTRRGVNFGIPVIGLRLYESPMAKARARFPIAVRMEAGKGLVSVDCPLFEGRCLPYWEAQLELARISTSDKYFDMLRMADGRSLRRLLDGISMRADEETLLLVHAYGCIRREEWWPGISDRRLPERCLHYGPTKLKEGDGWRRIEDEVFDLSGSRLSVLRVRSGADGEVPDYFTDEKPQKDGERACYCKQGLFPMDDYVLALTEKPNDKDYNRSLKGSKFDSPSLRYNEKALNEYCLLTSGDERKMIEYAKYAEALRGNMVQLAKSDMRVSLPGPLHLAACMEEYVWATEKTRRRARK